MLRMAVAVVVIACALLASAHAAQRPALRLAKTRPVELRGSGFAASERVRVVLHAGGSAATAHSTAGAAGDFTVTFRATSIPRCAPLNIVATGSAGSRARLLRRNPECAPD